MNALFPFAWTLGWAFLTQVLLFQHGIFWGGYGLLAVHLYGLLKMPVGWPPTTYLMVTAVTGALMDLICLTGGMHLAASVTGRLPPPSRPLLNLVKVCVKGMSWTPHEDG